MISPWITPIRRRANIRRPRTMPQHNGMPKTVIEDYTFKAVITVIVTGFVGAVWLGIKVMLGK